VLKKTITYQNFDGDVVNEDWYFNLSIAELAKMHLIANGDMVKRLQSIVASGDGEKIIAAFEDIISKSVGKRSDDGKRFLKSPEITAEFMGSEAYSTFFVELVTNANAAAEFINAVMPGDLAEQAAALQKANQPSLESTPDIPPRTPLTPDDFSWEEMLAMSETDLRLLEVGQMFDKPGSIRPVSEYTREELLGMSDNKFAMVAGDDPKKWTKEIMVIAMKRRTRKK
jgi:hypothetical protein